MKGAKPLIISASRRTDIPACYAPWLVNRLREGWALVPNPRNPHELRYVDLAAMDGIVLWSKNPAPLMAHWDALKGLRSVFQFTLTAYGPEIEPGLPRQAERVATLRQLAALVGPERVLWRYDPILLSDRYDEAFHEYNFTRLADELAGCTGRCTVSFLAPYRNTARNKGVLGHREPEEAERLRLLERLATIAAARGIAVVACAQAQDYSAVGVGRAACVDGPLFHRLWGVVPPPKDPGQRPGCGCVRSVDLGAYNTCALGCLYCYANYNPAVIARNRAAHDPLSPMLVGRPAPPAPQQGNPHQPKTEP